MHAGPGNPVSCRPPSDPAAAWSSASSSVLSIAPQYLVPGEQSAFRATREPCTEGRRAQKDDFRASLRDPPPLHGGPGRASHFRYVFHCHIVEHEENEMMGPYDVVG